MIDITMLVDRSGSMSAIRDDVVGGVNAFVAGQQAGEGECCLTLVLFDHEYVVVHDAVPINHVQPLTALTYQPRGSTALFDSIDRAVADAYKRLEHTPDDTRAMLIIVTDGAENASQRIKSSYIDGVVVTGKTQINNLLSTWRATRNYEVMFLAANQDAMLEGASLGVAVGQTMTFAHHQHGTATAYAAVTRAVSTYRTGDFGTAENANLTRQAYSFTAEERLNAVSPKAPDTTRTDGGDDHDSSDLITSTTGTGRTSRDGS